MGICLVMKLLGSLIASENLVIINNGLLFCFKDSIFLKHFCSFKLNYNTEMHRLAYGLLALVFAAFAIFLPETRKNPLPRCILQVRWFLFWKQAEND
jgi:hypothetical protein